MSKKKIFILVLLPALLATALFYKPARAFNQSLLMDDTIFSDVNSMSANQIDAFLNNFPSSCISSANGFGTPDPVGYAPSTGFVYGNNVSAGQAIYDAAHAYDMNPKVIIATLQKESSVVTGTASYGCQYINTAMGYDCPDSGSCPRNPATESGFSKQIIWASWLLKRGQQRSEGNVGWMIMRPGWDNSDEPQCYGGPMTQGSFKRCVSDPSPVYYDGYTTIDSTSVHMDTGATASLYWYTPHFSGNQSFVNLFTSWFGGTVGGAYYSCQNASNVEGAPKGQHIIANHASPTGGDRLSLVIPNSTGSHCIEIHTWANNSYQSWIQHTATNYPNVDPGANKLLTADTNGDGRDELYLVEYSGTSSGMIEVHGWDSTDLHWVSHVATNRPGINAADAEVIAADTNGDGRDELYLVQYRNTSSGMIEVHGWSANLQQWVSHVATNRAAIDPANAQVIAADLNSDGKDEFYLVQYNDTSSGMIEVHGWSANLQQWVSHVATNRAAITHLEAESSPASDADVISADANASGPDELYLIQYHGTSSGMVEVHGWSPNLQQWVSHIATSEGTY